MSNQTSSGGRNPGDAEAKSRSFTTTASSSNFSWRNPSPEKQKKYGIVALGDDFEPTLQEQRLLEMYETIKAYEKRAAYLKKDAALRKLQERNADFLESQNKQRKVKRKRTKQQKSGVSGAAGDDDGEDDDDGDEDDDMNEEEGDMEDEESPEGEAKLEEWRREVAEAKEKSDTAAKEQEEMMIAKHLTGQDANEEDADLSETILTKKQKPTVRGEGPSLLANLGPMATPPHDFSSKLGLEGRLGKVLFPGSLDDEDDLIAASMAESGEQRKGVWTPPEGASGPNDGAFLSYLEDFDVEAAPGTNTNNTLAIKFSVPSDSRRFSLNIAQADQPDHDFNSILFHFNPRQRERGGQVVMNDKQDGVWGQPLNIPLSRIPVIFGEEASTLLIQIHTDGFDIFLENQHCARLEHRQDLLSSENSRLCLQFPSTDDYASPENWKVFKVWWGYKPIMASSSAEKLAEVPGVNSFNSIHPRKLFIRNLPKIHTSSEVDIRRAELERAFGKYGGSRGIVTVSLFCVVDEPYPHFDVTYRLWVPHTYAFVFRSWFTITRRMRR